MEGQSSQDKLEITPEVDQNSPDSLKYSVSDSFTNQKAKEENLEVNLLERNKFKLTLTPVSEREEKSYVSRNIEDPFESNQKGSINQLEKLGNSYS